MCLILRFWQRATALFIEAPHHHIMACAGKSQILGFCNIDATFSWYVFKYNVSLLKNVATYIVFHLIISINYMVFVNVGSQNQHIKVIYECCSSEPT